jgi:hypothetical protein
VRLSAPARRERWLGVALALRPISHLTSHPPASDDEPVAKSSAQKTAAKPLKQMEKKATLSKDKKPSAAKRRTPSKAKASSSSSDGDGTSGSDSDDEFIVAPKKKAEARAAAAAPRSRAKPATKSDVVSVPLLLVT